MYEFKEYENPIYEFKVMILQNCIYPHHAWDIRTIESRSSKRFPYRNMSWCIHLESEETKDSKMPKKTKNLALS